MKSAGTLLLTRRDVAELLTIEECIPAVETVFKLFGEGKTAAPGILGFHAADGGFHIKAGLLDLNRPYFAAKLNANFPQNARRFGLPLIQGVIALCDAENGYPLALMDSIEITILRTCAATAVAAKYLSRPDSKSILICGCGNQGAASLRALSLLFPLQRAFAYDMDHVQAEQFSRTLSDELRIQVTPVSTMSEAIKDIDILITCTPSKDFFVKREDVRPGTFVAAVGADSEEKQELEPALLGQNKVVVDVLEQCAGIGELHHALEARLITKEHVYAELGEVVAGVKPGRTSAEEVIIFDSTGMALQDVVSAATVYEKAVSAGMGVFANLAQ
ncbi:MAG: ornithine cyclodeaminase family protein [Pyrinomonadaceae bacterium]